jgi:hypothetical protein
MEMCFLKVLVVYDLVGYKNIHEEFPQLCKVHYSPFRRVEVQMARLFVATRNMV